MKAKVLTIAQQKGGAGKTTLAVQLGMAFSEAGRRVAMIDIDPQGSLIAWDRARGSTGADNGPYVGMVAGWKVGNELERLKRDFDLVLIDSPPHAETEAKMAVRAANLVLVPVQPSPMDVWATKPTLDVTIAARVPALVVLNRVPPRGKVIDAVRKALAEDGVEVAESAVGNRVAFAASMMEGRGVTETAARSPAALEIRALRDEIASRL